MKQFTAGADKCQTSARTETEPKKARAEEEGKWGTGVSVFGNRKLQQVTFSRVSLFSLSQCGFTLQLSQSKACHHKRGCLHLPFRFSQGLLENLLLDQQATVPPHTMTQGKDGNTQQKYGEEGNDLYGFNPVLDQLQLMMNLYVDGH